MAVKFDIILPTFGQETLVEKCLESIYRKSVGQDIRIIGIDNGPPKRMPPALPIGSSYLPLPENIGYTKAINAGLALSTAPYVVLMNSDTEVMTDGWLEKLAAAWNMDRIAAVGPATDRPQQGLAGTLPKDTGLHIVRPEMTSSGILNVKLWFWCIMLRREAILDVGYLDERFSPGGGDDDDWLRRAYERGWKAAIQTDVLVKHVGQASWPQLEPLEVRSERAHRLLKEKYV